jgi:hypothetical protein
LRPIQLWCVLALGCAACGDGGEGTADAGHEPAPEPWQLVFEGLEGALISVAGTSASDVWAVGADTRDGDGALVLHYDGEGWTRLSTGVEVDLWWVHPFAADDVLLGGAEGTVLRYDGSAFEVLDTPGSSTVYGLWGEDPDDVWVVGGDPDISPGFVWRWDGEAFTDVTSELPDAEDGPALFKVWGRAADDVWIVGMEGAAIHFDGERFERADSDTDRRLFTVHGSATGEPGLVAVGGFGDAVITELDGTTWHDVTPQPAPPMLFGVRMDSAEHGFAVGAEGSIVERRDAAWELLDTGHELFNPFHAVWIDPDGGVWAVGGDFLSPIPVEGKLLHRGAEVSDAIED